MIRILSIIALYLLLLLRLSTLWSNLRRVAPDNNRISFNQHNTGPFHLASIASVVIAAKSATITIQSGAPHLIDSFLIAAGISGGWDANE